MEDTSSSIHAPYDEQLPGIDWGSYQRRPKYFLARISLAATGVGFALAEVVVAARGHKVAPMIALVGAMAAGGGFAVLHDRARGIHPVKSPTLPGYATLEIDFTTPTDIPELLDQAA